LGASEYEPNKNECFIILRYRGLAKDLKIQRLLMPWTIWSISLDISNWFCWNTALHKNQERTLLSSASTIRCPLLS